MDAISASCSSLYIIKVLNPQNNKYILIDLGNTAPSDILYLKPLKTQLVHNTLRMPFVRERYTRLHTSAKNVGDNDKSIKMFVTILNLVQFYSISV